MVNRRPRPIDSSGECLMQDGIRMEVAHLHRPVRDPSEVGWQLVSTDSDRRWT